MNRGQIVTAISDELGVQKKEVERILAEQDRLISKTLAAGDAFILGTVGRLQPVHRASRTGRNPATGEEVQIEAKNSAKFKPSKDLIAALG